MKFVVLLRYWLGRILFGKSGLPEPRRRWGHAKFFCLLVQMEPTVRRIQTSQYLMIQEFLNMIDRQEMFTIHGDNDSIPDLRNEHLWLVFDLHVAGRKNF